MRLKTSVVPIFNKMKTDILNHFAFKGQADVVPRQSRSISLDSVLPEFSDVEEVSDAGVVVVDAGVCGSVVFDYEMGFGVISAEAEVHATHVHQVLVNYDSFLVMAPKCWQNAQGVSKDFYIWRQCF